MISTSSLSNSALKRAHVFIRSTSERTEGVCKYSVLQNGFSENQITILRDMAPFSAVLQAGYEQAIEQNADYTFFVNADSVMLPGAMNTMVEEFDKLDKNTFFCNPITADFFSQSTCAGNPHLYRTSHIPHLLPYIQNETTSIRPETDTIFAYEQEGHSVVFLNMVASLHEWEQYNKDIFRRTINRFHKKKRSRTLFKKLWQKNMHISDFAFALSVFSFAAKDPRKPLLDYTQYQQDAADFCEAEKNPIDKHDIPTVYQKLIDDFYKNRHQFTFKGYIFHHRDILKRRLILGLAATSVFFFVLWIVTLFLQ